MARRSMKNISFTQSLNSNGNGAMMIEDEAKPNGKNSLLSRLENQLNQMNSKLNNIQRFPKESERRCLSQIMEYNQEYKVLP